MIKTFINKDLSTLFETGNSRAIPLDLHKGLIRQLDFLHRAETALDMILLGHRLYESKGERRGIYIVMVNDNWRLTSTFTDGNAFDVDLEDYN